MNWSNPAGWSSRSVPGSNQRVVISSGTVTVTGTNEVGYLTLGGTGSLTGNGTLVLTGTTSTSEWSGGLGMSNLTLQIATGAQLNISGTDTSHRTIDGATLSGSGTVKWTGGLIRAGNASLINVGTFLDATTDGTINVDMGGPPGTLRVAAGHTFLRQGTGTSTINIYFENFGLVSFLSGNVLLQGGSFFSAMGSLTSRTTPNCVSVEVAPIR